MQQTQRDTSRDMEQTSNNSIDPIIRADDDWLARYLPGALGRERRRWAAPDPAIRRIHWLRFGLAVVALMTAAAHLFALPAPAPLVTLWLDVEISFYVLIAIVYLLGLRRWYLPAIGFTVLNVVGYFGSGLVAIPGIISSPLANHLDIAHYSFGSAISVIGWTVLLVVGTLMLRLDHGSRLNEQLRHS